VHTISGIHTGFPGSNPSPRAKEKEKENCFIIDDMYYIHR
jgi:hypothetical protein